MAEIESVIHGSDKLTNIFGYWPTFHDAEVIEIHFWRGDIDTDNNKYVFPVLTAKLHLWEVTREKLKMEARLPSRLFLMKLC